MKHIKLFEQFTNTSSFLTYDEFISEETKYLNLDDVETQNTLASFDTSNSDDVKRLGQVKTSLVKDEISHFLTELLQHVNAEYVEIMKGQLINLFINNINIDASENVIQDLKEMLIQENGIYKFNMSDGINNSVDSIAKHYSKYFPQDFFIKLNEKQLGVRPMTGPSEGLLALFTDLKFAGKGERGDLRTPLGGKVEVKGKKGRVGDLKYYSFVKQITEAINKLGNNYESVVSTEKYPDVFNKKPNSGFIDSFAKGILNYADEVYTKLNKSAQTKFVNDLINAIIGYKGNQSATNTHSKIMIDLIKNKDVSAFHDFKAVLDFEGYRNVDGFQYLLLTMFDGAQSGSNVNLKNSFLVIDFKTTPSQKLYDIFRKYVKPIGKAEWHTNGTGIVGTFKK